MAEFSRSIFKLLTGALVALVLVSVSHAQIRRGGNDKVAPLSDDEAAQRWNQFSASTIASDYCMTFSIAHNPRKGETVPYEGIMYGGVRKGDTLTRIRIKKSGIENARVDDFILLNSKSGSKIWRAENGKFVEISENNWHTPLTAGLIFSPFDILAPYRFWNAKYIRAGRIGKAVYFFELSAPKAFKNDISKVEIAITRDFNSPAQTEIFDKNMQVAKTVSLGAVKKFDGLWILLELSARDAKSRDTDKFRFRAAAVNLKHHDSIFSPDSPATAPALPELKRL